MPKKKKKEAKEDDTKLFAFLATFLSIVGFILALVAKKQNKYVMFYAKQSLIVFIAYIIAAAITVIPFIGWVIGPVLYFATFILWIISWVYALSGNMKEVPVVGHYAKEIKL